MDTLWAFLSSLFTGIGAALALTVAVALLLHYVARASVIVNALLSLLLIVLASFQFVLLFGAEAVRGYVHMALDAAQIAGQIADVESVSALISEVPGMGDYVDDGRQGLMDGAITLRQLTDDVLLGYIWRRCMWLGAFLIVIIGAGFLLPSRRRTRHTVSDDFYTSSGGGYGSSSSTMNF